MKGKKGVSMCYARACRSADATKAPVYYARSRLNSSSRISRSGLRRSRRRAGLRGLAGCAVGAVTRKVWPFIMNVSDDLLSSTQGCRHAA